MSEVMFGRVVWFNNSYGFVKPDNDETDLFVHYSNIVAEPGTYKKLVAGQRVSYTLGENNTGPQAENVTVLEEPVETEVIEGE